MMTLCAEQFVTTGSVEDCAAYTGQLPCLHRLLSLRFKIVCKRSSCRHRNSLLQAHKHAEKASTATPQVYLCTASNLHCWTA